MVEIPVYTPNPLPKLITLGELIGSGRHFGHCAACGSQFMSLQDKLAVIDGEKHCPRCAGHR